MAARTVRLDEEGERALAEVQRGTGLSVSAALKRGLVLARDAERQRLAQTPYDVYETLDLGSGGTARARAADSKRAVRAIVARKSKRR